MWLVNKKRFFFVYFFLLANCCIINSFASNVTSIQKKMNIATGSDAHYEEIEETIENEIHGNTVASDSNAKHENLDSFHAISTVESDIPSWYTLVQTSAGRKIYTFLDRNGTKQNRIFGTMNKDIATEYAARVKNNAAWHECDIEGNLISEFAIDTEQEDFELAPYRYKSVAAIETNFKELSSVIYGNETEIFNKNRKIQVPHMGINYDGSFYDIWAIYDLQEEADPHPIYYMYGHKVNKKGEMINRWYQCNEQGQIREDFIINPSTKDYSNDPCTLTNYSLNSVLVDGVTSWGTYPRSYSYVDGWKYYGSIQGLCLLDSNTNNVGKISYPMIGGKGYGTSQYKNYAKNGWAMVDIKSTSYRHDTWDWTPNYLNSAVNLKCGQLLILKFSDGGSWPFTGYINTNKGSQFYNGKLVTNADRDYQNRSLTHFLIPATTNISGNWLVYVYGSEHNKNDADKNYYIYSPISHTIKVNVEHNYVNGTCSGCGYTPHTHKYSTFTKRIKEPNCIETGTDQYSCSCGGTQNKSVPALGHIYEVDYYTEADNGTYYRRCTGNRCDSKTDINYNPYTISYHGNGSTAGAMATTDHIYGTPTKLSTNLYKKEYYTFQGWNTEALGTGIAYTDKQEISNLTPVYGDNVDFFAQWTPNKYHITYNHNHDKWGNGDTIEVRSYDNPIGEMPLPIMEGYTFKGWYRDRSCTGNPVTEFDMVEPKEVTYYAKWEARAYTIHFDTNLYSLTKNPDSRICIFDAEIGSLPDLSAVGYEFVGWYTDAVDGKKIDSKSLTPLGETTYYAHWEAKSYDLELITKNAQSLDTYVDVIYDNPIGRLPIPVLEDFSFLGWYQQSYNESLQEGILQDTGSPDQDNLITEETIWKTDGNTQAYAYFSLLFIDNGDNTNSRPGPDAIFGTEDDNYYFNGNDNIPGSLDDIKIHPGLDKEYGTKDDFYINRNDSHTRPGPDSVFGTNDDENWWNGLDELPGTKDDKKIYPGGDGEYGTGDDYIISNEHTTIRPGTDGIFGTNDDENWWNGTDGIPGTNDDKKIFPGSDEIYGTEDDYCNNGNNTHTRPGPDEEFGTIDDENWWNGSDAIPRTDDDKRIEPGADGEPGTTDDYYDNGNNTHTRPGADEEFGTTDDENWWNGPDGIPGTDDDKRIEPGADGEPGTNDDYYDNGNNTHTRPGADEEFGTTDDENWWNGPDRIPGTDDDRRIESDSDGESGSNKEDQHFVTGGRFQGTGDKWIYIKPDGCQARDEWIRDGDEWYHINHEGLMDFGWFLGADNQWYMLNDKHDGYFGAAKKGWHFEEQDGRWYYLDTINRKMQIGWKLIEGKYFYFEPVSSGQTYYWDNKIGWYYDDKRAKNRPYGSMYCDEIVFGRYRVNINGVLLF